LENKNWLTKTMAVVGTILVTLPILAPIIFMVIQLISTGKYIFDYLMPAELGLSVLIGAGFILWSAIRARNFIKWNACFLGIAIVLIFGGQGLAIITGLASGEFDAAGWRYGVVLGSIIGYDLAVLGLVAGGVMLLINLFHQSNH
jgi:hypothetical protein